MFGLGAFVVGLNNLALLFLAGDVRYILMLTSWAEMLVGLRWSIWRCCLWRPWSEALRRSRPTYSPQKA